MAEYSELDSIIGKMKRAAIDCWMADQSFYPAWGADHTYAKWGWAPYQYHRPDENGEGGGESVGYGDGVTCAAQFDGIRSTIDGIVEKWKGLPDGSLCDGPKGQANATAAILGSSAATPSVQGTGAISSATGTINMLTNGGNIQGAFREPYTLKYITAFSTVQNGLSAASAILEANYAAEEAMWPAAQSDVATICDNARSQWASTAGDAASASATFQLTVAAAVVGAVGAVLTAGTGTALTVAAIGTVTTGLSTALAKVAENAAVNVDGSSYEEILGSLQTALDKLDTAITEQELALSSGMLEAKSTMRSAQQDYNLDAVSLGDFPLSGSDGSMKLDRTDTNLVNQHMKIIEDDLNQAVVAFGSHPSDSPTRRPYGVGPSPVGTDYAAGLLHDTTRQFLQLTAAEYAKGRAIFNAVVDEYFNTDAAARQTVQQLLADEALTTGVN